ncbi:uncharacterized protein BJ171DRAFT_516742 [Polychytrium aggregatum]|uniref:uncharacterized protein n=1 Tax=Polychytrium aggregatum TaxID=110093 RepID=UPI0022FDE902|nr:uncharacterized protein BJ171DRAFT_516742 [Polychytrium aggregatum]KAI9201860.1 hypothetical protein BJ171DRAFT_516742 [Polychytrium aggregatum]
MVAGTGALAPSLDLAPPFLLCPDIFAIVCFNDAFQRALDFATIQNLLRVCKRAQPLLSSKITRFHSWCQKAGLHSPDGSSRIGLTPSDQIALSLHCRDPVTAGRSWLEDQSARGNASASYLLARILQDDLDCSEMRRFKQRTAQQQIFELLESATNSNHPMAQFHLAECFLDGIGVNQDHTKAVEMYRGIAGRGVPRAQIALGRCSENGEGVDQSYDTAIEWYAKAEAQGSSDGRLRIEFLRGWFAFIGHGVEQSDIDALGHWQEVSTKSGDAVIKPIATHMVGWMHYLGRGTVQDKQKGVQIIRDNKSDEFPLGEDRCLACGFTEPWICYNSPGPRKFLTMCQLGSEHDWLCKHLVALCQYSYFGTIRGRDKARGIFEELANDGHSDSQLWIGECYFNDHEGSEEDMSKAFQWFSKSANQGNSYGQWRVGYCYFIGEGATKDYAKAVEWFSKSAEQGNRYAEYYIGECYQYGYEFTKNDDTAELWYCKAEDQGL